MSSKKDLFEPISPPRQSSTEPSPKKPRLEPISPVREHASAAPARQKISSSSSSGSTESSRHHHRESTRLTATLKPLPSTTRTEAPPVTEVVEEAPKAPSLKEIELSRWTPSAVASIPKRQIVPTSDDAVIRRKLMFEAGNPPASSHRGIKLLTASIASLLTSTRSLRTADEVEAISQRIQLQLTHEQLTLTRLAVCGQSIKKMTEVETKHPAEVASSIESVKAQTAAQEKRLEQASKTEARFKEYLEFASSIRKLQSYEDLVKQRDDLKEETVRLKAEKDALERQQSEKYPFVMMASWALGNIKYEKKKTDQPTAKTKVVTVSAAKGHPKKDTVKHRKSPKKSSKEVKSTTS